MPVDCERARFFDSRLFEGLPRKVITVEGMNPPSRLSDPDAKEGKALSLPGFPSLIARDFLFLDDFRCRITVVKMWLNQPRSN